MNIISNVIYIGINKKNEEFWALTDVSFHVKKGEVVGLIGSNGAGKSTLVRCMNFLEDI